MTIEFDIILCLADRKPITFQTVRYNNLLQHLVLFPSLRYIVYDILYCSRVYDINSFGIQILPLNTRFQYNVEIVPDKLEYVGRHNI